MTEIRFGGRPRRLLPEGTGRFFRRRAREGAGLAVTGLGGAIALALLSYEAGDPSINHAAPGPVANWLGQPGANGADLALTWLGQAGLLLAALPLIWGWRLMTHRVWRLPLLSLVCVPPALVLSALALDGLPAADSGILAAGRGGLAGAYASGLLREPLALFGLPAASAAVAGLLAALPLLALATGLTGPELGQAGRTGGRIAARLASAAGDLLYGAGELRARLGDALVRWRQPAARAQAGRGEETAAASPVSDDPADDAASPSRRVTPRKKAARKSRRAKAEAEPALDLGSGDGFQLPPLALLQESDGTAGRTLMSDDALEQNARLLESVLEDYGVRGQISNVRPGPVVTLYELEPAPGTKTSRVIGLADDIARSMSAVSVRVAVVPGRNAIGIELPNQVREMVLLRELLETSEYDKAGGLALALGKDIGGTPVMADLARMPHLLIAGTTGSGKSVAINTMVLSLLYRLTPEQCRLIMIDPKMLELSVYDDIPHLLSPVVTDPSKAVLALKWVVREMEDRYRRMAAIGVRNVAGYNQRIADAQARGEELKRTVQTGFDPETGKPIYEDQPIGDAALPFIVVIVDEMADLMMVAGKDIEGAIQRLAQMARAAGIHLIMATQRPSVDVITGTIKANFPTRISFQVTSKIDSRTILGEQGAEQLLGQGDMLYMAGGGRVSRVHGPFVSDEEVERVVATLKAQGIPNYLDAVTEEVAEGGEDGGPGGGLGGGESGNALFDQAVDVVARHQKASTSFLQRQLKIGYNRAANLIEEMEEQGMISRANHVGKREIFLRDPNET